MDFLHIVIPLLFLLGGIYAIVYWLYPHMQATTNNPVLYTFLVVVGVILLNATLPLIGITGFGKRLAITDLLTIFIR